MTPLFVLVAAAVASESAVDSSYPVEPVLDQARSSCETVFANRDPESVLSAGGWKPVQPQPGSWLADELKDKWDSVGTPHRQYAKSTNGRVVYLIFGTDPDPRLKQSICSFRDPKAVLRSNVERILKWAGQEPIAPAVALPALPGLDDVGFVKRWSPGLSKGSDETMINYAKGSGLSFFAVKYEEGIAK